MITVGALLVHVRGLEEAQLRTWIAEGWVRPDLRDGEPVFEEIDLARCRLILELREEMEVNEAAMPVVLHLLDRLHATRRQLRLLAEAVERTRGATDDH